MSGARNKITNRTEHSDVLLRSPAKITPGTAVINVGKVNITKTSGKMPINKLPDET